MNMTERFQRWYAYEKDSHAKVLASLDTVPEGKRSSPEFVKAVELLAHMVAARRLWMFRLGRSAESPQDIFPEFPSLASVRDSLEAMQAKWATYLEGLTETDLTRVFTYRNLEGKPFQNSVLDVLTQLFGHSLYHRGQIALLVRTLGGEPAATDFIYWCREPVPERD